MSKFNSNSKGSNTTVNHEGAVAYNISQEMELYSMVCTTTFTNKFYETQRDQLNRLRSLIRSVSPNFVARLAVYAREQMYLRTIPLVMTVELAKTHSGDDLISRMTQRVIQRADEITELLAFYQLSNQRTGEKKLAKLSNQIKKGIRNVFQSGIFNAYQYSKYNRKKEVRLRDALFLTHPKPQNDEQKELFDAITSDTLETAYTWESQLSEAGKADSDVTSKKVVWEEMISSKKMGYMATLRNLRNILEEGVSKAHVEQVCAFLSNPTAVRNSKQLPFRFLSAYRMLNGSYPADRGWGSKPNDVEGITSPYMSMVLTALECAISESIHNIPMFDNENVLVATDVSASMMIPVSDRSVITTYDIGTVLSMMLYKKCESAVTGMFGDSWKVVNFPKNDILRNADEIYKREGEVGYSTNGYKVLDWACKSKVKYDRVMMFTDCQMWDSDDMRGGYARGGGSMSTSWNAYRAKNPNCKLFLFDLQGYGTTPVDIRDNNVHLISGWSDKIFDILASVENGSDALEDIKSIEL